MMMMMMIMITSPGRLIQKRTDKLLDFSSASQRAEKNRDATKNRLVIVIVIIVIIVFIGVITVIIIVITIIILIMSCGVPTPLDPLDRANCGFQINPISLSLSCCQFNPSQVFWSQQKKKLGKKEKDCDGHL